MLQCHILVQGSANHILPAKLAHCLFLQSFIGTQRHLFVHLWSIALYCLTVSELIWNKGCMACRIKTAQLSIEKVGQPMF